VKEHTHIGSGQDGAVSCIILPCQTIKNTNVRLLGNNLSFILIQILIKSVNDERYKTNQAIAEHFGHT
jgi:hypothetical protein